MYDKSRTIRYNVRYDTIPEAAPLWCEVTAALSLSAVALLYTSALTGLRSLGADGTLIPVKAALRLIGSSYIYSLNSLSVRVLYIFSMLVSCLTDFKSVVLRLAQWRKHEKARSPALDAKSVVLLLAHWRKHEKNVFPSSFPSSFPSHVPKLVPQLVPQPRSPARGPELVDPSSWTQA